MFFLLVLVGMYGVPFVPKPSQVQTFVYDGSHLYMLGLIYIYDGSHLYI